MFPFVAPRGFANASFLMYSTLFTGRDAVASWVRPTFSFSMDLSIGNRVLCTCSSGVPVPVRVAETALEGLVNLEYYLKFAQGKLEFKLGMGLGGGHPLFGSWCLLFCVVALMTWSRDTSLSLSKADCCVAVWHVQG